MRSRLGWLAVLGSVLFSSCLLVTPAWAQDYELIITRAYEDILGRKPDQGGLRNYRAKMIDENWSERDVRDDLRKSGEYRTKGVDLVIKRAYQDLLNRDPDRGGMENYRKRMLDENWDERKVREDIRKSDEYRRKNR